jgi:hypothetical protein
MEIDNDLVVTLESDTKDYSSVTRFLREAKFPSPNPPTTFSQEDPLSTIPTTLSSLASLNSHWHQFASYQDSRICQEVRSTGG